ncbi:transcriptional Coactivator p15-domain-containing protein [Hypoxylon crocopeplum]|nr:transcriptional Coactivator p15-domain-containing protein [Hypoxylon crocopeplum]
MGRTKNLKRSRRDDEDEDASSDHEVKSSSKSSKSNKKIKTSGPADSGKDDEGNPFWSLGGTRRATISGFKGKTYLNIREYYTDASGSLKPGKKGIMLSPEQYIKLLEAIPSINTELQEKGHELPDISSSALAPEAPAPEAPAEAAAPEAEAKSKKIKPKKAKANIEATSDEDEETD